MNQVLFQKKINGMHKLTSGMTKSEIIFLLEVYKEKIMHTPIMEF